MLNFLEVITNSSQITNVVHSLAFWNADLQVQHFVLVLEHTADVSGNERAILQLVYER
jgi:hypothetical protein